MPVLRRRTGVLILNFGFKRMGGTPVTNCQDYLVRIESRVDANRRAIETPRAPFKYGWDGGIEK